VAFIYKDGTLRDLNELIPSSDGWVLDEAYDINESGQIVGYGRKDGTYQRRAFLLTPGTSSGTDPIDSASDSVSAGGTLSTVGSSGTATQSDPVGTSVTSPIATTVAITEKMYDSASGQQPVVDGLYTFFGQQIDITVAQASTWDKPYKFEFVVDSSLLDGATAQDIEIFRNGARVADCDPAAAGKASPDPCVVSPPEQLSEGDIKLTVYTSDASKWNIGKKTNPDSTQELYNGFKGFFSPVNNFPTLNTVKAGSAVPVKFSLGGDKTLDIFASGYPKSVSGCGNTQGSQSDAIEQTVNANSSKLTYDSSMGQYNYVWKSEKAWAGICRQLTMVLKDGSSYRANFQFTK
jgi:hypothetical protein